MPRSNRNKWSSQLNLTSNSSGGKTQQVVDEHDEIFKAVQEMFDGRVQPEVIHLILEESNWEVEKALEGLFDVCGDGSVEKIKKSKLRQIAEDILIGSSSKGQHYQTEEHTEETHHQVEGQSYRQNESSDKYNPDSTSFEKQSRKSNSIFGHSSDSKTSQLSSTGSADNLTSVVNSEQSVALNMQELSGFQHYPKGIGSIGDPGISKWNYANPFDFDAQLLGSSNIDNSVLSNPPLCTSDFTDNSDSKFFPSAGFHGGLHDNSQVSAGLFDSLLGNGNTDRCASSQLGAIGDHCSKSTTNRTGSPFSSRLEGKDDKSRLSQTSFWMNKENKQPGDQTTYFSELKDMEIIYEKHCQKIHEDSIDDEIFVSPEKSVLDINFDDVSKLKRLQMEVDEDSSICIVQETQNDGISQSKYGYKEKGTRSNTGCSDSSSKSSQQNDQSLFADKMDVLNLQLPDCDSHSYHGYDIDRLNSNELDNSFSDGLSAVGFNSPLPSKSRMDSSAEEDFYFPSAYDADLGPKSSVANSRDEKTAVSFLDSLCRTSLSPRLSDVQIIGSSYDGKVNDGKSDGKNNQTLHRNSPFETCLKLIDSGEEEEHEENMADTLTKALKRSLNMTESVSAFQTDKSSRLESNSNQSSPEKLADVMTAALKKSLGISSESTNKGQGDSGWNVLGLVSDSTWTPGQFNSDVYFSDDDDDISFKEKSESLKKGNIDDKIGGDERKSVADSKSILSVDAPEFVPAFIPSVSKHDNKKPTFFTPKYSSPSGGSPNIAPVYVNPTSSGEMAKLPFSIPLQAPAPAQVPAQGPWGHPIPAVPLIPIMPITQIATPPLIASPINYSAVVSRGGPPVPPPPVPVVEVMGPVPETEDIRRVKKLIASNLCMIVLRGLPGSGKSTLAKSLKGRGVIFSTDDYFMHNGVYKFDPQMLPSAHDRNRLRTIDELKKKTNPIIIDNTNTQAWEMKPYLKLASKFGYEAVLLEPDTPWKFTPKELARRNTHGVPLESLQRMLDRYQKNLTVQIIMGKSWVNNSQTRPPKQPTQRMPSQQTENADEEEMTKNIEDAKWKDWGMDIDLTSTESTVLNSMQPDNNGTEDPTLTSGGNDEDLGSDTDMAKLVENNDDSESDTDMTKMAGIHDDWGVDIDMPKVLSNANWELEPSAHWKQHRYLAQSSLSPSLSETGSSVSATTAGTESDKIDDGGKIKEESEKSSIFKSVDVPSLTNTESITDKDIKFNLNEVMATDLNNEIETVSTTGASLSCVDAQYYLPPRTSPVCLEPKSMMSDSSSISPVRRGTLSSKLQSSPSSASTEYQTCSDVHTDIEDGVTVDCEQIRSGLTNSKSESIYSVDSDTVVDTQNDNDTKVKLTCNVDNDGRDSSDDSKNSTNTVSENDDNNTEGTNDNIFSQLEIDVREQVEELIRENVGHDLNPSVDYTQTAKELKAILLFMSLENDQEILAEKFIDHRLLEKIPANQNKLDSGDRQVPVTSHVGELYKSSSDEAIYHPIFKPKEIEGRVEALDWEKPKQPRKIRSGRKKHTDKPGNGNSEIISDQSSTKISVENEVDANQVYIDRDINQCVVKNTSSWDVPQPRREIHQSRRDHLRERFPQGHINIDDLEMDSPKSNSLVEAGYQNSNTCVLACSTEALSTPDALSSTQSSPRHELSVKPRKKKKTSRKKFLPKPFLDDAIKNQFQNTNWSMPDLSSSSSEPVSPQKKVAIHVNRLHRMTEITSSDLKILNSVNRGDFGLSSGDLSKLRHKIIVSSGKDINMSSSVDSVDADEFSDSSSLKDDAIVRVIKIKPFVDRGTMTEEIFDAGLDFLVNSFPSIPKDELSDTLQQCSNDVEWAVSLLLDWKYHLPLSKDDKQKFVDQMYKIQHVPKSATIPKCLSGKAEDQVESPNSLLDMCISYIEHQKLAERPEIEQQMIRSSQQRLNSIEDNIRIRRTGSFISENKDLIEEDNFDRDQILKELTLKSLEEDISDSNGQVIDGQEEMDTSQPSPLGSGYCFSQGSAETPASDLSRVQSTESIGRSEDSSVSLVDDEDRTDGRIPREAVLSLNIPPEVTKILINLFGPVTSTGGGAVIPLDLEAAASLHRCWKEANGSLLVDTERQLKEDEEFARKLQEEENSASTNRHRPAGMAGNFHGFGPEVTPLKAIIQEEIEKEQKREQEQQRLEASGVQNLMASNVKRKLLYAQFPGIDETLLDDLFADNGYHLENTVRAIQDFLSHDPTPPQTVRTSEAADAYENKLIEAAKQQSLQEMLDSCLYNPQVTEDYQTTDSPEYEDYRGEANIHYQLRHECFQKAQEAFKRGMKEVASFYSQQGHQHTQKIKEANMRASDSILKQRNRYLEENSTLDLHGLHVDEAITALERIMPEKEREFQNNPDKRKAHLTIITGRGSHSKGGVAKLRPAVQAYLQRKNYSFTAASGYVKVLLKRR